MSLIQDNSIHQGEMTLGKVILFFYLYSLVINLVLYTLIIFFIFRGVDQLRKRKKKVAMVFFGLASIPLLHYTYQVIQSNFEADTRQRELNNLNIQEISSKTNRPHAMLAYFSTYDKELQALVATGVLDEVQQQLTERYTDKKIVSYYTREEGDECINFETSGGDSSEYRRIVLARYAFQRCAKEEKRDGLVSASIELFTDDASPNKYNGPACLGGGNRPLELRWTKNHGGELISFWESSDFLAPLPILQIYPGTWLCQNIEPWDKRYHTPDKFRFVATALGYANVDDFPKYPDATIIPSILKKLIPELKSQYANDHILALLGQWPSTPQIDKILNDPKMINESYTIIIEATKLLTDEKERKRLKSYYPYLFTHLPSFNKMCKQGIPDMEYDVTSYCDQLSQFSHISDVQIESIKQ